MYRAQVSFIADGKRPAQYRSVEAAVAQLV
jgi:hypothetical protein